MSKRIESKLDEDTAAEQAGFGTNYSTIDHMHAINQLRGKCQTFYIPLCLTFADFEEAFGFMKIDNILRILE